MRVPKLSSVRCSRLSVPAAAQLARTRGVPMIAFSTDSSVAGRGVYLLSFLPETDVNRIVEYSAGTGKRSFAAFLPRMPTATWLKPRSSRPWPARVAVLLCSRNTARAAQMQSTAATVAQGLANADALLLADDGDVLVGVADTLVASGANLKRLQLLGTGLWDNPRVFGNANLQGGFYAAPDPSGFRSFSGRYRNKYGQDPVRTATLAYDSVALVAALARTQGGQRFSPEVLTNPSGFAGIDGLFRFRSDGTNERGLAVMRAATGGGQAVSASPKSFGA